MEKEDERLDIESKELINTSPKSSNILEEKIEKSKKGNNLYDNFNVISKQLILKLNYHTKDVCCLCILDDGRLVTGSDDSKIIIYNKITYKPDLIIKEHNKYINCIIKLYLNILASCSSDNTIKLFKINDNYYEILQTLDYHSDIVYKIIEIRNKNLASCSDDKSIIFYYKDNNNKYHKDYQISTSGFCKSITQIKENEICYLEIINYYNICFYDLSERKIKATIHNISSSGSLGLFNLISKDNLFIGGNNQISIINVIQYELIKIINLHNSGDIYGYCKLNQNMFLIGDDYGAIIQMKIDGDNIHIISKKEKAHNDTIYALIRIGNGKIASCSFDKSIKIW